jgi:sugar phosphate isomerase/epimerase
MSWRLGVATGGCIHTPIATVLDAVGESGFRLIEIGTPPQHFDPRNETQVRTVKERLRHLGIEPVSIHAPFGGLLDLSGPDSNHRRQAIESVLACGATLSLLGGSLVVVHPSDTPRHGEDVERRLEACAGALAEISEGLDRLGARLALETPLPHLIGGDPAEFQWLLSRLDPRAGVCLDTGHATLGGFWHRFLSLAGSRLVHVHADDHRGSFDDHLPPGDGILDWREIAGSLRAAGYAGDIVLELSCPATPLVDQFRRARAQAETLLGIGTIHAMNRT